MAELLTAGVIQAALGLLTVIATGVSAWYLKKYGDEKDKREEAEAQGDIFMQAARKAYNLIVALCGTDPKMADKLEQGNEFMKALETGWVNSKTRTPEMQDYYDKLFVLLEQIGAAKAAA